MIPSFANSAGWNWIGPDLDGEERAADLLADAGQPRHQQQRDRGRGDRVAVALEHAVVADEQDRGAEEREPNHEPLRLLARQLGVDPVDHHHAHRREQGGEREHVGVGVRQPRPDEQVREHAQAEEDGAVGERGVAHVLGARGQHGRKAGGHQQRHRQQPEQLARCVPTSADSCPRSSARTRSTASSRPRHSWSSTRSRRRVGNGAAPARRWRTPARRARGRTAARRARRGRASPGRRRWCRRSRPAATARRGRPRRPPAARRTRQRP